MTIYADYRRDRVGWFFGLAGWQVVVVALTLLPPVWALNQQRWLLLLACLAAGAVVVTLAVVPIRGRSFVGWMGAVTKSGAGGALGWTRWRSKAARGRVQDLDTPDLPGVLSGVAIHDGPPWGSGMERTALIQHHPTKTWAVTAAVVHPGIGLCENAERDRQGAGLGELLDVASRTELVEEVLLMVRTVPEDGAERAEYVRRHRKPTAPALARQVNDELAVALTTASVRTESFVTLVVSEARLARRAKQAGGGLDGRARELIALMGEFESHLRGGLGMTSVTWLTSPALAVACRTGFAPGDAAAITAARSAAARGEVVNAEVPWALAGPSGTDWAARHYAHDAWHSASVTLVLPERGAVMGALAPVLAPHEPGERRSLLIAYPILRAQQANRQSANQEWAADLGAGLRSRMGVKLRAKQQQDLARTQGLDVKLARGHSMVRPYAVATVTVPRTRPIGTAATGLDAAVRQAGFAPLRLDLAHDAAFVASSIPLGTSLTRGRA